MTRETAVDQPALNAASGSVRARARRMLNLASILLVLAFAIFMCQLASLGTFRARANGSESLPVSIRASSRADYSGGLHATAIPAIQEDILQEIIRDMPATGAAHERMATLHAALLSPVPTMTADPRLPGTAAPERSPTASGALPTAPAVRMTFAPPTRFAAPVPTNGSSGPMYPPPAATATKVTRQPTRTPAPSRTSSATPTRTPTPTTTSTATRTSSPTATSTVTRTPTASSTATGTFTRTPTSSPAMTVTPTATATASSSATVPPTASATSTLTPSPTETSTQTPTHTATTTPSSTHTATETPTPSATPTQTPTNTATATASATSTASATQTPSATPTPTLAPTETPTHTATATMTATRTLTPTLSATPMDTAAPTLAPTPTDTPTSTPTPTDTAIATFTSTATGTAIPTQTASATGTDTPTPSATASLTPTSSPTASPTMAPILPACYTAGIPSGQLPSDDTYIDAGSPTKNFGSDNRFEVRPDNGADRRGLLKFDLSSIPAGAHVTSATLYLYEAGNKTGQTTSIYRVTSNWNESTATWSTWSTPGGDFDMSTVYSAYLPEQGNCLLTLDITGLVQAWVGGTYPNYGLMLYATGPNHIIPYSSKENTALDEQPKLDIVYVTPTATP